MKPLLNPRMNPRQMRRTFARGLLAGLRVVWPLISGLLIAITALGIGIGLIEGWSLHESIYFAFVTGLTIGYGDHTPKILLTRVLAITIGLCGVLLTALFAAIAVKALSTVSGAEDDKTDP